MRARAQLRIERELVAMAQGQAGHDKRKAERLALENHPRGHLLAALDLRHEEADRLLADALQSSARARTLEVQLADARQKNGLLDREVRHYRAGWMAGAPFEECPSLPEPEEVPSTHPIDEGRVTASIVVPGAAVVTVFVALFTDSVFLAWSGLALMGGYLTVRAVSNYRYWRSRRG
jgi:hypothetical protein